MYKPNVLTRGSGRRIIAPEPRGQGRAFDAAGASGFAFLQSQLELIDTDLVQPLQAVTHARDITVEVGGGFPEFISAWAANYKSTGTQFYGLQGTNNTEIAEVQADIQKAIWKTFIWSAGMTITYIDLQRMESAKRGGQTPPFSLQELYDDSCKALWNKALDYVVYFGFMGLPGLINSTACPETAVPQGAGHATTWVSKTPQEILSDVNFLLNAVLVNCAYDASEGMPDRMLVPQSQYSLLTNPMTLGGIAGFENIKDYIERSCIAAQQLPAGRKFQINPLPNPWISGMGTGPTDRAVVYRNDKKSLYLKVPTAMQKGMTVPTTRAGGAYETIFVGCVSQVIYKRTQTMIYGDGI